MPWRIEVAALLLLAGCAGARPAASGQAPPRGIADEPVRIGPSYEVAGRTYVPADDRVYDEVGVASLYGDRESGATASGERYDPDRISAAHPTLPLPSYVEVTSLVTGRTILVRINDRGPFGRGRIIDLSRRAAAELGQGDGLLRVRVRRAFPPESDRAALRAGQPAAARLPAPPQLLAALNAKLDGTLGAKLQPLPRLTPAAAVPPPDAVPDAETVTDGSATPAETPAAIPARTAMRAPTRPSPLPQQSRPAIGGDYFVQLGAFSDPSRAKALARSAGARAVEKAGMWRVRLGPYPDRAHAAEALAQARARGYRSAALVRDPPSP